MWKIVATIVILAVNGQPAPESPETGTHAKRFTSQAECETFRAGDEHKADLAALLADEQFEHAPATVTITTECLPDEQKS